MEYVFSLNFDSWVVMYCDKCFVWYWATSSTQKFLALIWDLFIRFNIFINLIDGCALKVSKPNRIGKRGKLIKSKHFKVLEFFCINHFLFLYLFAAFSRYKHSYWNEEILNGFITATALNDLCKSHYKRKLSSRFLFTWNFCQLMLQSL